MVKVLKVVIILCTVLQYCSKERIMMEFALEQNNDSFTLTLHCLLCYRRHAYMVIVKA